MGIPSIAACGGNSSERGSGGPGSGGQSLGMAGDAAAGVGTAGASGAGGMIGSSGNAGARSSAGTSGTAGTPGTAGTAGASACTDLVNVAPAIEETYVSDAPPAPTGGAVQDGTYFETAFVNYAVASVIPAPVHRFTARITGNRFEAVYSDSDVSEGAEQRITFTFTTSDSSLSGTRTCLNGNLTPGPVAFTGYDATPTALTLHLPPLNNSGGVTYTLNKR